MVTLQNQSANANKQVNTGWQASQTQSQPAGQIQRAKPKILCVIPARIGSVHLVRKPLLPIVGKPLIQRTYEQAIKCPEFDQVIVATDSEEVAEAVFKSDGLGTVEMTDKNIASGIERVAVVAGRYPHMDVIVSLQCDEPFIKPEMLSALVRPYVDGTNPYMATIAHPLDLATEYKKPNIVKVLCDKNNYALYFSRGQIPYFSRVREELPALPIFHHVNVYAFRREFLLEFARLPQLPLELAESLESLRALEHGYEIFVSITKGRTWEINSEDDLKIAELFVK